MFIFLLILFFSLIQSLNRIVSVTLSILINDKKLSLNMVFRQEPQCYNDKAKVFLEKTDQTLWSQNFILQMYSFCCQNFALTMVNKAPNSELSKFSNFAYNLRILVTVQICVVRDFKALHYQTATLLTNCYIIHSQHFAPHYVYLLLN